MLSQIERDVCAYIDEHREEMLAYLKSLIRIDTQVPPGKNYDRLAAVMGDKFSGLGCDVGIYEATDEYMERSGADFMGLEGPRSNVVATYPGSEGGPVFHISAHLDCAAIQDRGWTMDPLGGQVTRDTPYQKSPYDKGGGYIWGRGVADDKGEIAAMTLALEAVHKLGVRFKGTLILTGNCDEEIGGVAGLGYLIQEGIVKADMGIQLDGGLVGIGLAAQGRTRFLLKTKGVSYHGQLPILGINAIEKMSKLNVALTDYWRNVLLKRQVPVPGIDLGDALREKGIDKMTAMLNLGTIKGGIQGATVPDLCEEEILRGMVPGETFEDVVTEFKAVLDGVCETDPELDYELDIINSREGYVVPADSSYALETRSIIEEALGVTLPFTGTLASTDMNYQVVDGNMPCVNFGVGGPYSLGHKQDENASIDEIIECSKAVALIWMRKLGVA
jgi:succinyl-diaminopimelate desuccinylase